MAFGRAVGSITDLKKNLKKGGGGTFIKYIPKEGDIDVRFLEEPENWLQFKEIFDEVSRRSYPAPDDEGMPGAPQPGDRVSSRYLLNAIDVATDKVIPLQIPKDLANQLVTRYEKYGTLLDRDYNLFKTGTGLDTVYGLTPDSPSAMNMGKYTALDLEKVLEDAYNSVWGDEAEATKASQPKGNPAAVARRKKAAEPDPEPDEDDEPSLADLATLADDDQDEAAAGTVSDAAIEAGVDPEEYDTWAEVVEAIDAAYADADEAPAAEDDDDAVDDDPGEDDAAPEAEGDDDTYTKAELDAMPIGALRTIARENGIPTTGLKKPALVDLLLGGEGGEEPF